MDQFPEIKASSWRPWVIEHFPEFKAINPQKWSLNTPLRIINHGDIPGQRTYIFFSITAPAFWFEKYLIRKRRLWQKSKKVVKGLFSPEEEGVASWPENASSKT
jgi:hypothetical protein